MPITSRNIDPELQTVIDRLVAATRLGQPPRNEDVDALEESWDGDVEGHLDNNYIAAGVSIEFLDLSDASLLQDEELEEGEITNEKRIAFARKSIFESLCDGAFTTYFGGSEIKGSDGSGAWVVFSVDEPPLWNFFGVFADLNAFRKCFADSGYLDCDQQFDDAEDTKVIIRDEKILQLWGR